MKSINWKELETTATDLGLNLSELFEIYFRQAKEKIQVINDSLKNEDFETLKNTAHFMVGSSATLNFENLRDQFKKLEEIAETKEKQLLASLVIEVKEELTRVAKEAKVSSK